MPPTMLMDIRRNKNLTRGEVARALGCSIPWLATIERHPRALAPNNPVIPKLAELLGMSEPEVQAFAKAEPFTEAQLKLSRFRMGRHEGGKRRSPKALLGSGDGAEAATRALVRTATSLRAARKARGLDAAAFAKQLGVHKSLITNRIDHDDIAPNHPLVPKIAKALGMRESAVRKLAKRPLMDEKGLQQSASRLGKPVPGVTRGARGMTWATRRKLRKQAAHREREPGTALVRTSAQAVVVAATPTGTLNGKISKRAYNALKKLNHETRQCARSLAMATTLAAMSGKKYLDVAIPTVGMAAILNDWFRLKGVREQVVTTVDYDEVFG
jgi:transcriptional regulator with XRE-family HTH domain